MSVVPGGVPTRSPSSTTSDGRGAAMLTTRRWFLTGAGAAAAAVLSSAAPAGRRAEPASEPAVRVFDLQTATIEDINAAFDAGALTSERLVELYLDRIEAYDKQGPNINAVITLNPAGARDGKSARRRTPGQGSAEPAARHARGAQGPVRHQGHADDGRLPADEKLAADARCHRRRTAARCGRDHAGQGEHERLVGVPKKGDQSTVLGRTSNPYNLDLTPGGSSGGTGRGARGGICTDRLAARPASRSATNGEQQRRRARAVARSDPARGPDHDVVHARTRGSDGAAPSTTSPC